jgi:PAS domain S-box-containing protein
MTALKASLTGSQGWPFLHGGGEMGALIRSKDWSRTPLGHHSGWPQSLRTTLSIVLNNRLPMFLFWGPELISFYNETFRPSLGIEGKHPGALGSPGEAVWPEIWAFIKPLIDQVLLQGEAVWMEDQLVPFYRNGRIEDIFWTFSYSPVEDESGRIAGVVVSCYETTEKLTTIRYLQASDQRFQNLVREANMGIIVVTGKDIIVEVVNEAYGRIIGRTPAELLGKRLFDLIPHAEEPFRKMVDGVRETGEPVYLYSAPYLVYSNGKKIEGFLDVIYQPYKEADGTITGVMALVHDVTERTISRKKLEEAEAKVRLAIESADLGTYEIDLVTENMLTSDRFNTIWGIPHAMHRSTVAGRIHPEDRMVRIAAHADSMKDGQLEYEARVIWDDGSEHWVRVKGKVIYDMQGKATSLIGVVQDISGEKHFSEELKKQVRERTVELRRSNDDLLQFAHVISHDLKEPVRKIKVYNSRILDELGESLPAKMGGFVAKVQNAADRMSAMIEGVLNYSSLSADATAFEAVDLNATFRGIVNDLEIPIQQKSASIVYPAMPTIEGAPILIYQLFYNLINNSLKFSRRGVDPVIEVSYTLPVGADAGPAGGDASSTGADAGLGGGDAGPIGVDAGPFGTNAGFVRIVVSDNGIGFDQEHAATIFQTFTRLNSKDSFEGTGLGLALCKKIVERHGGSISATGVPGGGARIALSLPIKKIG